MSARAEQPMEVPELLTFEQNDEASMELSPNSTEEKTETNLEPLHIQICAFTQTMNKPILDNSAIINPTASPRSSTSVRTSAHRQTRNFQNPAISDHGVLHQQLASLKTFESHFPEFSKLFLVFFQISSPMDQRKE